MCMSNKSFFFSFTSYNLGSCTDVCVLLYIKSLSVIVSFIHGGVADETRCGRCKSHSFTFSRLSKLWGGD